MSVRVVKPTKDTDTAVGAVIVLAPFQISHNGHIHYAGQRTTVPAVLAERWQANGWAAITDAPTGAP